MPNLENAIITVEDNKLRFTQEAIDALGITPGDRVAINYYTVNCEESFPVIAKSTVFADAESGNKLTKSKTCSYRGEQREILLEYGDIFQIEELPKKKFMKLVGSKIQKEEDTLSEEESSLKDLDKQEIIF